MFSTYNLTLPDSDWLENADKSERFYICLHHTAEQYVYEQYVPQG